MNKKLRRFSNKIDATKCIQKQVKIWLKHKVKRKEARDEIRLKRE